MSSRLRDGNPNVADLNDQNRPVKLGEQFSELYDNQWTDAFEVLKAGSDVSDEDACHILLKTLCVSSLIAQFSFSKKLHDFGKVQKYVFHS